MKIHDGYQICADQSTYNIREIYDRKIKSKNLSSFLSSRMFTDKCLIGRQQRSSAQTIEYDGQYKQYSRIIYSCQDIENTHNHIDKFTEKQYGF